MRAFLKGAAIGMLLALGLASPACEADVVYGSGTLSSCASIACEGVQRILAGVWPIPS